MTRDEILEELVATTPSFAAGDPVYLERRGDDYSWHSVEGQMAPISDELPDAWLFHMGPWPTVDRAPAFVDDLLDELNGGDRCRWPLDEPWPKAH